MEVRNDFPIFTQHPTLAYLDNAAMSQVPQRVIDAVAEFDSQSRANVHRGVHTLALTASDAYEKARADIATFIHASPEEIIFTSGATGSLNMLVGMFERSMSFSNSDTIVTTVMEHHSAYLPFRMLAERQGMHLSTIKIDSDYNLDIDDLEAYIPKGTKIIVVTLASNVLGTINDLSFIVRRAKDVGAYIVVDAAKAAGHIPIDVEKLGCDFLVFSGHKMCAPTGIGVLYGRKEILEKLEPHSIGGGMVLNVTDDTITYAPRPARFEAGTPSIAGAVGLGEAAAYLSDIGVEDIHKHIGELVEYTLHQFETLKDVTLFTQRVPEKNAGVISFTLKNVHPHDIAQVLSDNDVAIRGGHHCALPLMHALGVPSVARVSFSLYNTVEDIDQLIVAIRKTQKLFS